MTLKNSDKDEGFEELDYFGYIFWPGEMESIIKKDYKHVIVVKFHKKESHNRYNKTIYQVRFVWIFKESRKLIIVYYPQNLYITNFGAEHPGSTYYFSQLFFNNLLLLNEPQVVIFFLLFYQ